MNDERRINYSYKNKKWWVLVTLGLRTFFWPIGAILFTIDIDWKHYTFDWNDWYMACVYALYDNNKKLYKKYVEKEWINNAVEYTIKEYYKYLKEH